jgi:hypothetical protein
MMGSGSVPEGTALRIEPSPDVDEVREFDPGDVSQRT